MTYSTENATNPRSIKSRNSKFSAHTQIRIKSRFEFVPWVTEKSEIRDWVDFGGVAITVEAVKVALSTKRMVFYHTPYATASTRSLDGEYGVGLLRLVNSLKL